MEDLYRQLKDVTVGDEKPMEGDLSCDWDRYKELREMLKGKIDPEQDEDGCIRDAWVEMKDIERRFPEYAERYEYESQEDTDDVVDSDGVIGII